MMDKLQEGLRGIELAIAQEKERLERENRFFNEGVSEALTQVLHASIAAARMYRGEEYDELISMSEKLREMSTRYPTV